MHLFITLVSLLSLLFGRDEAEIVFAGDAMMHTAQLQAARQAGEGNYDYSECFAEFAPYIQTADYAVVNLETPVSPPPYSGYPCFNAPGSYIDALHKAGFDLFLTANNHTLDRRDKGLTATIDSLDRRSLRHIGTYKNQAARNAMLPMIIPINRIKVAFLNYTYGTNGIAPQGNVIIDYIDRRAIADDINQARKAGAEIITVCIHWGDEYCLSPNVFQRSLADFLVEQGVDLIIGGHPHVVQPMEVRHNKRLGKDALVVYSLGNLISNMKTRDTRGGAIVRVRLIRDDNGVAKFDSATYRLHFTVPAGQDHNFRLFPADGDIPATWRPQRDAFVRSAESNFSRHNKKVSREN